MCMHCMDDFRGDFGGFRLRGIIILLTRLRGIQGLLRAYTSVFKADFETCL